MNIYLYVKEKSIMIPFPLSVGSCRCSRQAASSEDVLFLWR